MPPTASPSRTGDVAGGVRGPLVRAVQQGPPPSWSGRRGWLAVLVLVGLALVAALRPSSIVESTALDWAVIGSAVLTARRPLLGWAATGAVLLVMVLTTTPVVPGTDEVPGWLWYAWGVPLLLAARVAVGRARVVVWVGSLLATLVALVPPPWAISPTALAAPLLGTAVPLALGTALRARESSRAAVAEERRRTAEARDAGVALAERARIAREMHDVVAHHMSLIAVRAETAPYRLTDLDPRALDELVEVAAAARAAMSEMQQLLGVLRSDDEAQTRPQPGLDDVVPALLDARAAGTDLRWRVAEVDVPDGLGLTAYRVVAQGLANAAQHAAGAPVSVDVAVSQGSLRVEVLSGPGRDHGRGGGTGLRGLRERVDVHGGTLVAGPTPDGGFSLDAHLPLDGAGGVR